MSIFSVVINGHRDGLSGRDEEEAFERNLADKLAIFIRDELGDDIDYSEAYFETLGSLDLKKRAVDIGPRSDT